MSTSNLARHVSIVFACAIVACGDDTGTGGNATTSSSSAATSATGTSASTTATNASSTVGASTTATTSSSTGGGTMMNFFASSDTSPNGNFGGLAAADARCQTLAAAVGEGGKTWRAYLSTENPPVNARDRIGPGPYYNAAGVMLAADKDALHALTGDPELFLTEQGEKVNGQWDQSPDPNEHDIVTGSTPDGMVQAGATCDDWTSTNGDMRVGHSDGLGPGGSMMMQYLPWGSSHDAPCDDPASTGGAAKIYCFTED